MGGLLPNFKFGLTKRFALPFAVASRQIKPILFVTAMAHISPSLFRRPEVMNACSGLPLTEVTVKVAGKF